MEYWRIIVVSYNRGHPLIRLIAVQTAQKCIRRMLGLAPRLWKPFDSPSLRSGSLRVTEEVSSILKSAAVSWIGSLFSSNNLRHPERRFFLDDLR